MTSKISVSTIIQIIYLIITTLFSDNNWYEVSIYALGMRLHSEGDPNAPHIVLKHNDFEIFLWVDFNVKPSDYLDYYGDILSVAAENDFIIDTLLYDDRITRFLCVRR